MLVRCSDGSRRGAPASRACGRTMAFAFNHCIVILILWIVNPVITCPDMCRCIDDNADCVGCSYEMIPDKNTSDINVNMCCLAANDTEMRKLEFRSNVTYTKVTVTKNPSCDLRYLNIISPKFMTTSLVLKNNSIEELHLILNGTQLTYLDLSHNKIVRLENNTFNLIPNLLNLKIDTNKLKNLSNNCFAGLVNLQYLDLSNNNIMLLSSIFYPLKNLQHLNLSRNSLKYLSETSFNNGLLQHLDVSHNQLSRVAPGALQCLPNLARLLLSDNTVLGATHLDGQLLVGTGRRLQQVDASRTGLKQIPEAFTHSVRFLSLAGNEISAIHCGDLDSYPLLQSLDFTDNHVTTVEDDSLGRLEMLLFLNLNMNLLTTVPKTLPDELKYLSINNNLIGNLTIPDFNNLPNLRILLLQNNVIEFIQENVFAALMSLEVLDLSNNPVQILTPSTFNGPLSLRDLRLCYLNISLPERDVTFPVPSPEGLQMLHLQSSPGLARQLLADSAVLAALSHLQYLDLRMNHLTDVRNDLVFYLSQLRTLRLHGNNINCTSANWLQGWMSKNHSSLNNETCYFSLQNNGNEDENRYNCTFSETFTINDSLPPVSLYSTEMINKLLKYYGFLNNTTELTSKRNNNNRTVVVKEYDIKRDNINISKNDIPYTVPNVFHGVTKEKVNGTVSNEIEFSEESLLSSHTRSRHEMLPIKKQSLVTSKLFMQAAILDENEDGKRILDSRINPLTHTIIDSNQSIKSKTKNIINGMNKTGRTINKPIKRINNSIEEGLDTILTAKTAVSSTKYATGTQPIKISALTSLNAANTTEKYGIATLQDRSESSPFQSNYHGYASYVGMFAVISLIAVCMVLWASLRLRYRQRRRTPSEHTIEDHIEVTSISGGVLW